MFSLPLARQSAADSAARGPLITCSSDPASPAAYLRVLVNEKPLDPSRLLSNVTRTYPELDELEVNKVAFRLRLDDFVISAIPNGSGGTAAATGAPDAATRGPVTARSPQPSVENSNARVQFDDQLLPPAEFSSTTNQKEQQQQQQLNELAKSRTQRRQRRQAGAPLPVVEEEPVADEKGVGQANIKADEQSSRFSAKQAKLVDKRQSRDGYLESSKARSKRQADSSEFGGSGGRIYSNNIKIKCTSLVPAIGYDMTAELNVSLTLIVPAAYLTDATEALSPGQPNLDGSRQVKGGLQLGKAVISEPRVAQASTPPAKILVASPQSPAFVNGTTNLRQETKGSSSSNNNNKRARNRASSGPATPDKERSKRLEKLSSISKPAGKYQWYTANIVIS